MTAARATIAALQRQLTAGGAERKELAARLAAAEMESSGCAEVGADLVACRPLRCPSWTQLLL